MQITKQWLKEKNACTEGFGWFVAKKYDEISLTELTEALIADKKFNWSMWVLRNALDKIALVKMAVFAAEQVIDLYEKKYPTDDRPRKAIDAAKAYIAQPSANAAHAAYAAANAAYAAAHAAYAAANAAYAAADAAYAAAHAAYAAANAADAAYAAAHAADAANAAYAAADAAYAAADAAYAAMKTKILRYGATLI